MPGNNIFPLPAKPRILTHKEYSIGAVSPSMLESTFIFKSTDGTEMLKIAKDGFYVRGVKLEQDVDEARRLYQGFKQLLNVYGIAT